MVFFHFNHLTSCKSCGWVGCFVCLFGAGCTLSRWGTCISIEPVSLWVLEKSSCILFPQWQFWGDTGLSTLSCNGWVLQVKS